MTETAGQCYADSSASGPDVSASPAEGEAGPRADCVLCGEPTEYPASQPGDTLCPVCIWQQAQRASCSG